LRSTSRAPHQLPAVPITALPLRLLRPRHRQARPQGKDIVQERPAARAVSAETPSRKDPMGQYEFDGYQGRLYRVFEGTVLEGVLAESSKLSSLSQKMSSCSM
jgi:hypothetical protein